MRNVILKVWRGESGPLERLLYPLLLPLSCIYRFCLYLRNLMYGINIMKTYKVPVPVISVGNITMGGTGKTPVVAKISGKLLQAGFHPAIATRGYKRKRSGTFIVDRENDNASDVGDEALMLSKRTRLPVFVGKNRAQAILKGINMYPVNVALLDDGFQLRNLKKDMEILLIDSRGGSNTNLFPLGPCREEADCIKKADIILTGNGRLNGIFSKYAEDKPVFGFRYRPMYLCNIKHNLTGHFNFLKDKNVLAFAGLGNNEAFFDFLKDLGANVIYRVSYPDHYFYQKKDIKALSGYKDADILVTTEKDAMKINQKDAPDNLYYLTVEVEIENEEEMMKMIIERLSSISLERLTKNDRERTDN